MADIVKGQIGNALESVAPDGIVATADAIYDETKGKYQEQINAEVGDGLNAQYHNTGYYECGTAAATAAKTVNASGYQLPATTPYGGSIKVKFTNKNSAANPTLSINQSTPKPLYYNGAIASASNTWDDNDVLELYYDGTNFNAKSVMEKFATGEKVKNVGIDSEPTAGSNNVVKSGGVYEKVSQLEQELTYEDGITDLILNPQVNITTIDTFPTGGTAWKIVNGKWTEGIGSDRYVVQAIEPNKLYRLTAKDTVDTVISLLAETTHGTEGADVNFAAGWSDPIVLRAGKSVIIKTPSNTEALYYQSINSIAYYSNPILEVFNADSVVIENIKAGIVSVEKDLSLVGSNYALIQGQVANANGSVTASTATVTTKAIPLNKKKVLIDVNPNYTISYRYGNASNSLSQSVDYHSLNGIPQVLDLDAEWGAFNIRRTGGTLTPSASDINFVLIPFDSADEISYMQAVKDREMACVHDISVNKGANYIKFEQGWRNSTSPNFIDQSWAKPDKTISTNILRVNGTYRITCAGNGTTTGYKMLVRTMPVNGSAFTELTPSGKTEYEITLNGYVYVSIRNRDESIDVTPSTDTGFSIEDLTHKQYISNISSEVVENKLGHLIEIPNLPYVWPIIGGGLSNPEMKYSGHYILRKGITYTISFDSNSFVESGGSDTPDQFSLYVVAANGPAGRTNLKDASKVIPAAIQRTPQFDEVLRCNCTMRETSYFNITIIPQAKVEHILSENIEKINETQLFRKVLVTDMFTKGNTVSDMQWKTAVSDGFDINEDNGMCCVGISGKQNYTEGGGTPWHADLAIFSIGDIEGTKRNIRVCTPNVDHYEYNSETIYISAPITCLAKWTGNNEITVLFRGGGIVYRKFTHNSNNDTWEAGDISLCNITVNSHQYQMMSNQATIEAIWADAPEMPHPRGRTDQDEYNFYICGNAIKVDDSNSSVGYYWYIPMSLGNYSHALLRSEDLINWVYVCPITFGVDTVTIDNPKGTNEEVATEEVAICYCQNRIYATCRGNYLYRTSGGQNNNQYQWSRLTYCEYSNLSANSWETPIVLTNCYFERPTIEEINGKIFVMQGIYQSSYPINGMSKSRGRRELLIFDTELNLLRQTVLQFDISILHLIFMRFGGSLVCVTSSDLRCFGVYKGGDGRSEIMISTLNPDLLYMVCERN